MEDLEKETICVNGVFSANRFWAISVTAVLSGTMCIKKIKVGKLNPP